MSLRIISPNAPAEAYAAAEDASNNVDHYMERLVKLVPGESIAAFPLLHQLAEGQGAWASILVAWLLLAVSFILRWHATTAGERGTQWIAVTVACVSFVIWVYVMGGQFGVSEIIAGIGLGEFAATLASAKDFLAVVALVIWTILVPVFYTGDSQ